MEMLDAITAALKLAGFQYVTLDCTGFRSGSMNAILPADVLTGAAHSASFRFSPIDSLELQCDAYWLPGVFFRHKRHMLLGALVDAGVSFDLLAETATALNVGARLELRKVMRGGLSATKVDVLTEEQAQPPNGHTSSAGPGREQGSKGAEPAHSHSHSHEPHTHEHMRRK